MSVTIFSSSWMAGFTVCLSLIISIGAQNLYVLRQAVQGQYAHACVAWCVLSDALLIAVGVAGMAQLMGREPGLTNYLSAGGALFLLAYGLYALWRVFFAADVVMDSHKQAKQRGRLSVISTLALITLLNPHVYLDTVLLVGSIGAREEGALKAVFVAGAACASLLWFIVLAFAGKRMQHWFANSLAWRMLDALTGVMMLALSWWVWSGIDVVQPL